MSLRKLRIRCRQQYAGEHPLQVGLAEWRHNDNRTTARPGQYVERFCMNSQSSICRASLVRLLRHARKAIPVRRIQLSLLVYLLVMSFCVGAWASETDCKGKPDALGVSRIIAVDPTEHPRIGTMQYPETLPLADHEVVLTFDDGPSPRYTIAFSKYWQPNVLRRPFLWLARWQRCFRMRPERSRRKAIRSGRTVFVIRSRLIE